MTARVPIHDVAGYVMSMMTAAFQVLQLGRIVNDWWCRPDSRPEEERGADVEHGVKGERFEEDVRVDLRGATQEDIIPERSTMEILSGLVDSGRANFGTRVNTRAREWEFKEGSQVKPLMKRVKLLSRVVWKLAKCGEDVVRIENMVWCVIA
jgi:hypothetical protein